MNALRAAAIADRLYCARLDRSPRERACSQ
jgi:hypothetical protein